MTRVCAALLICFAGAAIADDTKRALSPVEFIELPMISSPTISADGRSLLFQQSATLWEENKIVRRLQLQDLRTGQSLPVPQPEEVSQSLGNGVWRPDGKGFAVLLERDADEHEQIYFFDSNANALTRLTTHPTKVESLHWSPDSKRIYFVAPAERDAQTKRLLEADWVIPAYDDYRHREVWQLDVGSGATRQLVAGDFSVRRLSLSRDGTQLVYARAPDHALNRGHEADVWTTSVTTGEHVRWTRNDYAEYDLALAPDNRTLAFVATVNASGAPYYEDKVFVQRAAGGAVERLLPDSTMEIMRFAWDRTGAGLYLLGNTGLRTHLYHYELTSGQLREITRGDLTLKDWQFDAVANRHVAIRVDATTPGDVVLIDPDSGTFEPLTDVYAPLLADIALPQQQAVRWRSRGGATIEGLLVYPIDYDAGKRYPLAVVTHGGPRSSSQFGSWNRTRYVAVLAGQGYAVLLPNHRGGTGYGDAFMRDMIKGYFNNAHHDVMAGVDAMIKRGIADPDQLIAMGWSAGGHMVNKLITFTDRFAAASSGAGAADWLSMYAESDVRFNRQWVFGGEPWQRRAPVARFRRDSSIQEAWRVTTPTLFFSGENDVRVPPTQSIMMYRGVRAAGAPTALYVADGQPHNYRKPSFQLFKINRELAWYAQHVRQVPYDAVLPAAANPPQTDPATKESP